MMIAVLGMGQSALLPLLLLLSVPVILHFFIKGRPPKLVFSSVFFLEKVVKAHKKLQKPKDWILLILRTLLVLFFVLMFLDLVWKDATIEGLIEGENKDLIVMIDASASMAAVEGGLSRYNKACVDAGKYLEKLNYGDRANVIFMKTIPESIFPGLGVNIDFLQEQLRESSSNFGSAQILAACQMASIMLNDEETSSRSRSREVVLISDFQKSGWEEIDLKRIKSEYFQNAQVKWVDVSDGLTIANGAVQSIRLDPSIPLVGEEVTLSCEMVNYSEAAVKRRVFLELPEGRQQQDVHIPAWGKANAVFTFTFNEVGEKVMGLRLDEDAFHYDDARWYLARVEAGYRVGIFSDDSELSWEQSQIWQKALEALSWTKVQTLDSLVDESLANLDMVLLVGIEEGIEIGAFTSKMKDQGISVMILPSMDVVMNRGDEQINIISYDEPLSVRIKDTSHNAFSLFKDNEYGTFQESLFYKRGNFNPPDKILLEFSDVTPALIQSSGALYWNVVFNSSSTNMYKQSMFVPLVGELLLSLRQKNKNLNQINPGNRIVKQFDVLTLPEELNLISPEGDAIKVVSSAGQFLSSKLPVEHLGVYEWRRDRKFIGSSVVNFPEVESDLRVDVPAFDNSDQDNTSVITGTQLAEQEESYNLWPYLLLISCFLLVSEMGFMMWGDAK